jgi:hypothetical protein
VSRRPPHGLTPAQLRRAHAAGFRPRSGGLELGARFAAFALVLSLIGGSTFLLEGWGAHLRAALRGELVPLTVLRELGALCSSLLLVVVLASLLAATLTRQLGPIRRRGVSERGGARRVAPSAWRWSLCGLAILGVAYLGRGVVAGASRASVASLGGLTQLWWAWGLRTLLAVSGLLTSFGIAEWLLAAASARRNWQRHLDSEAEARSNSRAGGQG